MGIDWDMLASSGDPGCVILPSVFAVNELPGRRADVTLMPSKLDAIASSSLDSFVLPDGLVSVFPRSTGAPDSADFSDEKNPLAAPLSSSCR